MRTLSLPTFPCWAGGTKRCHLVWNTNLAQHSGSCQMSNVLQRDSPTLQYVGSMKRGLKKWVAGYKSWQRFEQLSTAVMGKENKYFLIFLENWINSYFCFLFCLSLTSSIQTTVVYITHSRSWLPCWSLVARCWVRFYGLKKVFAYILSVFSTPSHLSEEFQTASVHEYFILSEDPHLLVIRTNNRLLHPNSAACTVKSGIH